MLGFTAFHPTYIFSRVMLDYYWVISRKKYTYSRVCIPFEMLRLERNVQILGTILKIALKLEKLVLQTTKPPYNVNIPKDV